MKPYKIYMYFLLLGLWSLPASAYEHNFGRYGFKLTGYGTVGAIEPDFKKAYFMDDWLVRTQINYALKSNITVGFVYSIDELAVYQDKYSRDTFLFIEDANRGRIELGMTDSIATKLGVGLPDVGGLRINDNPIFYKRLEPTGPVISNTTMTSGRYDLRANFVSVPTRPWQFGASVAGLSPKYNYATDVGVKYRDPNGKTKNAFSMGASFIDSPENFQTEVFAPSVTADWRAQISTGFNLQYNSWIWGISLRGIYDRNPIGVPGDGLIAGTGISYDLLNYTVSASYILSDTGIWNDAPNYISNTGVLSFRYKYSEDVDGWISTGLSAGLPFMSGGIRMKF
ncbi:MAG TPA: hypothetical protein PKJ33_01530 [Alphaproteobacteria bacterium]|nr:hypothetical protein [Alphaproteobacteria bacterium]